jgi:hypothetical protein
LPVPENAAWSLSPNGRQVAWLVMEVNHQARVHVFTLATGRDRTILLPDLGYGGGERQDDDPPLWSADGRYLAVNGGAVIPDDPEGQGSPAKKATGDGTIGALWAVDLSTDSVNARLADQVTALAVTWTDGDRLLLSTGDTGGTGTTLLVTASAFMAKGPLHGVAGPALTAPDGAALPWTPLVSPGLNLYIPLAGTREGGVSLENSVELIRTADHASEFVLPVAPNSHNESGFAFGSWGVLPWVDATYVMVVRRSDVGPGLTAPAQGVAFRAYTLTYLRLDAVTHVLVPLTTSAPDEVYRFAADVVSGGQLRPGEPPHNPFGVTAALRDAAANWSATLGFLVLALAAGGLVWFFWAAYRGYAPRARDAAR